MFLCITFYMKIVQFILAPKIFKIVGINLTKEVKVLCNEKYEALMKEVPN